MYQIFEFLFRFFILILIPHGHEFDIGKGELALWILLQLIQHGIVDRPNRAMNDPIVLTDVILIRRFFPAGILVRVRDHMYCYGPVLVRSII